MKYIKVFVAFVLVQQRKIAKLKKNVLVHHLMQMISEGK